ncbi:MAG: ubiquitin-like small modifier protein 1 [Pyrinomonadaceae bacterium]
MSVKVHLSGHLKAYSGNELEVDLPGEYATVGDVLRSLWDRHAALRDRVLNEQGEIRQHVNVFVGSTDVKCREGLSTRVETNDIHIFNAVSGG